MATHSSILAGRIPGTGKPGGLPSVGSHRVRHDWSDLAAAAVQNEGHLSVGTNSFFFFSIACTLLAPNEHQNPGEDWNNSTLICSAQGSTCYFNFLATVTSEGTRRTWKVSRIPQTLIKFSQALRLDGYHHSVLFSWHLAHFILRFFYPTSQKVHSKIGSTKNALKKKKKACTLSLELQTSFLLLSTRRTSRK